MVRGLDKNQRGACWCGDGPGERGVNVCARQRGVHKVAMGVGTKRPDVSCGQPEAGAPGHRGGNLPADQGRQVLERPFPVTGWQCLDGGDQVH